MGIIESINISREKGTVKIPVSEAVINFDGIENDAHSGDWHRQVSLLAKEDIDKFSEQYKQKFNYGDFAENITTSGIDLKKLKLLDIIQINDVKLITTQKGKKCHGDGCAIYTAVGHCVMPKEGVFSKVISSGKIKVGDEIKIIKKLFKVLIITLSDRASERVYEDQSGPEIEKQFVTFFDKIDRNYVIDKIILPDDFFKIQDTFQSNYKNYDIIVTTGGTGISRKDITIEAIKPLIEKEIPGIMENIRLKYGQTNPKALLSRSMAATVENTLIFCLPGSPKAVKEYMNEIFVNLEHLIYMLHGLDAH